MDQNDPNNQIFHNITPSEEPVVMESVCVNCNESGETTMMMTKIPMFKEVILISFYCSHCGYKNSEATFGGKINDYATRIELKVIRPEDFKRDCIRSEFCSIRIPELDFEIPCVKKGSINTIEGFISNAIDDLQSDQDERKEKNPELFEQMAAFIKKLQNLVDGYSFPFHFIFDDPSGNSFIKNPFAPNQDHQMVVHKLPRTVEQLAEMGYSAENAKQYVEEQNKNLEELLKKEHNDRFTHYDAHKMDFTKPLTEDVKGESLVFKVPCHSCGLEGEQKMCTTSIPYFKELIIMSFLCGFCGTKSTEVKAGGEVSEFGKEITLMISCEDDIRRDLFKSETCALRIPNIDFEMDFGTLGGVYTTVEGLFEKIEDNLRNENPFAGDSADSVFKKKMKEIWEYFAKVRSLEIKDCKIILRDLMDNSFIQNPYYPDPDPRVHSETFTRSYEENDILGLNDIKVEGYGEVKIQDDTPDQGSI